MTVYVDDARIPFGRMLMCHMVADTSEELQRMARQLQLAKHIQYPGTWKEHYDLGVYKRGVAIAMGAVPTTTKELIVKMRARRS